MTAERWGEIARLLFHRRDRYEGFVVLHGTDTMAYTASALSFMLPQFGKPIVLTGSQLPIGVVRTDGKENLLTAIEIAGKWDSADPDRGPLVREVVVYFGDDLLRGNRSHKQDAEGFQALVSPNFPALAEVGVHVRFRRDLLLRPRGEAKLYEQLDTGCDRGAPHPQHHPRGCGAPAGHSGLARCHSEDIRFWQCTPRPAVFGHPFCGAGAGHLPGQCDPVHCGLGGRQPICDGCWLDTHRCGTQLGHHLGSRSSPS